MKFKYCFGRTVILNEPLIKSENRPVKVCAAGLPKNSGAPTESAKAASAFVYIFTFVGLRRVASLKRRPAGAEDLPSPTEETSE